MFGTRMRLGHLGLRSSLFVMGIGQSGSCGVCGIPETEEHILMSCSSAERKVLRDSVEGVGREWGVQGILGTGNGALVSSGVLNSFARVKTLGEGGLQIIIQLAFSASHCRDGDEGVPYPTIMSLVLFTSLLWWN